MAYPGERPAASSVVPPPADVEFRLGERVRRGLLEQLQIGERLVEERLSSPDPRPAVAERHDPIDDLRRVAALQQAIATFASRQRRDAVDLKVHVLRLHMARTAFVMLPLLTALSGVVLVAPGDYPDAAVVAASASVFAQSAGVVFWSWRVLMRRESVPLNPTIDDSGERAESP